MKLKTTTQLFANLSNGNSYSLNLASINLFKILIFSLSILVNAKTSAQTTIFSDNFGSSTGASYDITGAIGSMVGIQRRPKPGRKPSDLFIEHMGQGPKQVLFDLLTKYKDDQNN